MRDPYKTLGVSRDTSDDDIKKAYRKLARQFHPDATGGDAKAEERFKDITEAYAVLSEPDKKELYDKYGEEGLREGFDPRVWEAMRARSAGGFGGHGGFGSSTFDLNDLFGTARGSGIPEHELSLSMECDFAKAARGFQTTFTYQRDVRCTTCAGRGRAATGEPCRACMGAGRARQTTQVTVNVPPGAADGDVLRLKGRGSESRRTGQAGDLLLQLTVLEHPTLRREKNDLITRLFISPIDSLLGTSADIELLDGNVKLTVPPGMAGGKRLRLKGKGVTRKGHTGDAYVEVHVQALSQPLSGRALELALALRDELQADSVSVR
jgi:molecular chaperone DnaJ